MDIDNNTLVALARLVLDFARQEPVVTIALVALVAITIVSVVR